MRLTIFSRKRLQQSADVRPIHAILFVYLFRTRLWKSHKNELKAESLNPLSLFRTLKLLLFVDYVMHMKSAEVVGESPEIFSVPRLGPLLRGSARNFSMPQELSIGAKPEFFASPIACIGGDSGIFPSPKVKLIQWRREPCKF